MSNDHEPPVRLVQDGKLLGYLILGDDPRIVLPASATTEGLSFLELWQLLDRACDYAMLDDLPLIGRRALEGR